MVTWAWEGHPLIDWDAEPGEILDWQHEALSAQMLAKTKQRLGLPADADRATVNAALIEERDRTPAKPDDLDALRARVERMLAKRSGEDR